jgi:hypothetical protein
MFPDGRPFADEALVSRRRAAPDVGSAARKAWSMSLLDVG